MADALEIVRSMWRQPCDTAGAPRLFTRNVALVYGCQLRKNAPKYETGSTLSPHCVEIKTESRTRTHIERRRTDHDDCEWRVYCDEWGRVGNQYQAFVAIQPCWAMYGK